MLIKFQRLYDLLEDMKNKMWNIDSFNLTFNEIETITILETYNANEVKPSQYAKVKVWFYKVGNIADVIEGWADWYKVYFQDAQSFYDFFNITRARGSRNGKVFESFANVFSEAVPNEKIIRKTCDTERILLAKHADPNAKNSLYCFDVRRSGIRRDGTPQKRTIGNQQKAILLRESLYEIYKSDNTLSFYFSSEIEDELSDEQIMMNVASRNY